MILKYAISCVIVGAVFGAHGAIADDIAARPLTILRTSAQVYQFGLTQKDPLVIIAAAKMRKSVGMTPAVPVEGQKGKGAALSAENMLTMAAQLAQGDALVQGIIEDVRAETSKGVANGPVYSVIDIRGGGTDTYTPVTFTGASYAEVYVEGKGASDLNLYVRDHKNRLVCSDTDISDIAYCGWRPEQQEKFSIVVENKGSRSNQYALITN